MLISWELELLSQLAETYHYQAAIQFMAVVYQIGLSGYQKSPEDAERLKKLLPPGVPIIDDTTIKLIRRSVLMTDDFGFSIPDEQGLKTLLRPFIEELVEQGDPEALNQKIKATLRNQYGYGIYSSKEDKEIKVLNEKLVGLGHRKAIHRSIKFSEKSRHGYPQDSEISYTRNEELVALGDRKAIHRSIEGFTHQEFGYPKDLKTAYARNEELVELKDEDAIERKFKGLSEGGDVYPKDLEGLIAFIEGLAAERHPFGVKKKIDFLKNGTKDFERDTAKYKEFVKELAAEYHPIGLKEKFYELTRYEHDKVKAPQLKASLEDYLDELSVVISNNLKQQDNTVTISIIQAALKNLGAARDHELQGCLRDWIVMASQHGKRWGYFLEVLGRKYSILGFEQKVSEAEELKELLNHYQLEVGRLMDLGWKPGLF